MILFWLNYDTIKFYRNLGSRAIDGKRFPESNASSIPGTYFRLGYVEVSKIEEAFDSRNLLPSTALDPKSLIRTFNISCFYYRITFVNSQHTTNSKSDILLKTGFKGSF